MAATAVLTRTRDQALRRILETIDALDLNDNLIELETQGYTTLKGVLTADRIERTVEAAHGDRLDRVFRARALAELALAEIVPPELAAPPLRPELEAASQQALRDSRGVQGAVPDIGHLAAE